MLSMDREYYRRRVEQETAAAESAPSGQVRDVHLDLAERYSAKLHLVEAVLTERPFSRAEPAPEPITIVPASSQRQSEPRQQTA